MSEEKTENTNCLAGLKCPSCGSLGPLDITVIMTVTMSDDGCDSPTGDMEFDDESYCRCVNCDHMGSVIEFKMIENDPSSNPDERALVSTLTVLRRRLGTTKSRINNSIPRMIDQLSAIEDLGDHSTVLAFTIGGLTGTLSILLDMLTNIDTLAEIALNQFPVREDGPQLIDEKRIPGREE